MDKNFLDIFYIIKFFYIKFYSTLRSTYMHVHKIFKSRNADAFINFVLIYFAYGNSPGWVLLQLWNHSNVAHPVTHKRTSEQ